MKWFSKQRHFRGDFIVSSFCSKKREINPLCLIDSAAMTTPHQLQDVQSGARLRVPPWHPGALKSLTSADFCQTVSETHLDSSSASLCHPDGVQIAARLSLSLPYPPAPFRGWAPCPGALSVPGGPCSIRLSSSGSPGTVFLCGADRQRLRDSGGDRRHRAAGPLPLVTPGDRRRP